MSAKIVVSPKHSNKGTPKGGDVQSIMRSHTSNPHTLNSQHTSDDEEDEELVQDFFESDMARRMSKAHAKRFNPKDLYETIPFFKEIPHKDR